MLSSVTNSTGTVQLSLDLGLTQEPVTWDGACLRSNDVSLSLEELRAMQDDHNSCFVITADGTEKVQRFSESSGHFYSLYPTPEAPSLLNAGFPMHRIKDTYPWQDTKNKISAARPLKGCVLDTCTGLGYTAIQAAHFASRVTTVEIDPVVHEIARCNPWSRSLFESETIEARIGNCETIVGAIPSDSLDAIIHDPPSVSLAGELYSEQLYREFHRVLNRGGVLFHYIGDPTSKLGHRTTRGVLDRVRKVGFKRISRRAKAFGISARK